MAVQIKHKYGITAVLFHSVKGHIEPCQSELLMDCYPCDEVVVVLID